MIARTLRQVTKATRVLDLSASTDLVCDNLMCEKVGELCLCKFAISFPKIAHVRELCLRENGMDRWPDVWNLPNLEVLDVSHNRLTDVPRELAQLKGLRVLDLSHNRLEAAPTLVCEMPGLRTLRLGGNAFDYVPSDVRSLHTLETLDLSPRPSLRDETE
mmetsp:Transcript_2893/g.8539  ORF Transcript_2893/g.8539 Transcript_2893/m.8539 type:complete len:160 (-) Transcript_2893:164-643(-)